MTKIIPKIHLQYKLVSSVEKGKKRKITTEFQSIGIRGRHVIGKSQDLELNRPGLARSPALSFTNNKAF